MFVRKNLFNIYCKCQLGVYMSKTVNKQFEEVTNVSKSNSPSFNTELSVCLNTNKIFENDKWVTPTICIFWWSGPRGFSYPRNLVLKTDHEAKIPTNIQSITNNFNSPQKRHYGDVIKISVKSSYNQTAHVNTKFSIFFLKQNCIYRFLRHQ